MVACFGDDFLDALGVLEVHQEAENLAVGEENVECLHVREDRGHEVAYRLRPLCQLALDLPDANAVPPVERLAVSGPVPYRRAVSGEQRRIAARPPELIERLKIARDAAKKAAGLLGVLVDDRIRRDLLQHGVPREDDARLRDRERETAGRVPGCRSHDDGPAVARQSFPARELVPHLERLREAVDGGDGGDDREARQEAEAPAGHVLEEQPMAALLPEIAAVEPPAVQRRARSVGHLLREAVMILMAVGEQDALHVGDLEAEPLQARSERVPGLLRQRPAVDERDGIAQDHMDVDGAHGKGSRKGKSFYEW